jgi:cyclophilin family peptidyl-prolyl cis-trans isomerase/HEAT repeat protein
MTRIPLLLLGFAALVACGPTAPPLDPGPERARHDLDDAEIEAIATVLRLEDHRAFEPGVFQEILASPSVEVRRRAVVAVGRIGDPAASALLVQMLARDGSPAVRADAAFALGLLGDTSTVVLDALRAAAPRDWTPVRDAETTVVVEVVGALGRLGTDRARAEVVEVLRRTHPGADRHSRRIAAEGLLAVWKFREGAGRTVSAASFLDIPDPELRWRAALALVRLGEPDGAARLVPALGDDDPRVRAMAARSLTAAAADIAGVAEAALEGLAAALADPHPHVRINAVRSLASFGDRAAIDAIAGRLMDGDPNVAAAAAGALATRGSGAAGLLAGFVADEARPLGPRAEALAELARLDPAAAAATVAAWSEGAEWERRYAAARAAGPLGWGRARPTLERLAADADVRVAVAATEAAAGLAGAEDLPEGARDGVRDLLLRLVLAAEPRQRVPALRGLPALLRPQDVPTLLDSYARSVADSAGWPAAIAAVRALGAVDAGDGEVAAAFFARFRPEGDRWVARAVAEALGDGWGPAPPAVAAEEVAFYADVVRRYVAPAVARRSRPEARIRTPHGEIRVELLAEEAPLTVHNFVTLATAGFYDDGVWHRVVPNFVLQDGAPVGDPAGGPGWAIRDEINRVRYDRGVVGMALAGPDTGGSQWFITHSPQPHLDGGYTVFGRVTGGEGAMDRVVQGEGVLSVRVRH